MDLSLDDFEVLISEDRIRERCQELGQEIRAEVGDGPLVCVGVLKGSFIFMADLVRCIGGPLTCDFLRVSSYEGTRSTGNVRIEFDLTQPIEGADVLLIEDIVDTGRTAEFLLQSFQVRQPRSLRFCSLLDKPARRVVEVPVDHTGFTIENRFVIGYGLDFDGRYRDLPNIRALNPQKEAELEH